MKILLVGDIYGATGLRTLEFFLKNKFKKKEFAFIVVNGENVSSGSSIIKKDYEALKKLGVDVITSGNHIFSKKEIFKYITDVGDLLVPINYSSYFFDSNFTFFEKGTYVSEITSGKKIRVTNIIGRTFMPGKHNDYLPYLEQIIKNDPENIIHLIDFHAEATAEKIYLAHYLDINFPGRVAFVGGTHTHVQTVDNRILKNGLAFISDIGMCGPYDSVIGADINVVIRREKYGIPTKMKVAVSSEAQFSAVVLNFSKNNTVSKIERIYEVIDLK